MADEKAPKPAAKDGAKPASGEAKPKKEKPPALEKKPFPEFIQQDFLPTLEKALKEQGMTDIQLSFDQQPLGVFGVQDSNPYWHVKGQWQQGGRQFNIAFTKDDITSPKVFYLADKGAKPSTIEQFMGDERKITLDLMVLYTLQRLNGQKWLNRN
jgi:hypothetical protein